MKNLGSMINSSVSRTTTSVVPMNSQYTSLGVSYVTNTLKVNIPGIYQITFSCFVQNNAASGSSVIFDIRKNTASIIDTQRYASGTSTVGYTPVYVSKIFYLYENDIIDIYITPGATEKLLYDVSLTITEAGDMIGQMNQTTQTITESSTKLTLSEDVCFDVEFLSNSLIVKDSGYYKVSFVSGIKNNTSTGNLATVDFKKNGSIYKSITGYASGNSTIGDSIITDLDLIYLNRGDILDVWATGSAVGVFFNRTVFFITKD